MAINFNAAADLGNNGGASSSLTAAYTCGGGANGLLLAAVAGDSSSDLVTGATYNGASMSLLTKCPVIFAPTRWIYLFGLLNPPGGSNNVVFSASGTAYLLGLAADYTGVLQSGLPDATNNASQAPGSATQTISVATVADNCWAVLISQGYDSNLAPVAGTGSTRRTYDAVFGTIGLFDSNGVITPPGSYSMSWSFGVSTTPKNAIIVSFAPAATTNTDPPFFVGRSIPQHYLPYIVNQ